MGTDKETLGEAAAVRPSELFSELVALMARLRGLSGCPWDRQQNHRSLRPCLLEETYEVLEAIDRDDPKSLCGELGDLLLQVVFHAQLAAEAGQFDICDVIAAIRNKLISRHPHVFGDATAATAEEVLHQWDKLKRSERDEGEADLAASAPSAMPALARAQVVRRRALRAGSSRTPAEARAAAGEALARLDCSSCDTETAVGDLLLAVVELAQAAGVDAEQVLRERVDHLLSELASERR